MSSTFLDDIDNFVQTTLDQDIANADRVQQQMAALRHELVMQAVSQAKVATIVAEGDLRDDVEEISAKLRIQKHALEALAEHEKSFGGRARLKLKQREVASQEDNSAKLAELLRMITPNPGSTPHAITMTPTDMDGAASKLEQDFADTVGPDELITDPTEGINRELAKPQHVRK